MLSLDKAGPLQEADFWDVFARLEVATRTEALLNMAIRGGREGGGAVLFVACFSRMTIDHASLERRSTVSTGEVISVHSIFRRCAAGQGFVLSCISLTCFVRVRCVFVAFFKRGLGMLLYHPRP